MSTKADVTLADKIDTIVLEELARKSNTHAELIHYDWVLSDWPLRHTAATLSPVLHAIARRIKKELSPNIFTFPEKAAQALLSKNVSVLSSYAFDNTDVPK